jgi:RNA polymerase sigma-70 factor (ECF subfamily)
VGIFRAAHRQPERPRTDAELLTAHVEGDRYAFEELFHRHYGRLYRLAHLTSRDPDDAADALQDAMLAAHRTARTFRHDCAVSSWLYRIVVNASLDRLRRNKSRAYEELDDELLCAIDPTGRIDTALVVQRALMGLPVEQRAAVVAVDMQGYSVADAARMLGVAEGTVNSRCSRARSKLAASLVGLAADAVSSDNLERSGMGTIGGEGDDERRRDPESGFRPRACRPHPGRSRRAATRRGPAGL